MSKLLHKVRLYTLHLAAAFFTIGVATEAPG